jgi:hypothetical protein
MFEFFCGGGTYACPTNFESPLGIGVRIFLNLLQVLIYRGTSMCVFSYKVIKRVSA